MARCERWRASLAPLAPHAVLLSTQLAGLAFFALPLRSIAGFPLDDAWIHQVVARTFAQTGTLGYAPGHHGAAATSWLWALVLSVNFRFVHAEPFAFTLAVNVALTLIAGQLLLLCFAGAARGRAETWRATAAVALGCFGGNTLWFAFSGMEADLVVVLSLLAAVAWTRSRTRRGALLAGVAAGALALTRPECAALGALLPLWRRREGRDATRAAAGLAPWSLALLVYAGVNVAHGGRIAPQTFAGRRWLWVSGAAGASSVTGLAADFFGTVAHRLRDYTLGTSATLAFWIGLGMAIFAGVLWVRERRRALGLVIAWTAVHVAFYALVLPSPGQGGRYLPLVPLLYLTGVGYGSGAFVESALRAAARGAIATVGRSALAPRAAAAFAASWTAALLPWAALVGVGVRDWRVDHRSAVGHIRATEEALATIVDALPPGARVASFDIGGVGYRARRPIIDLGGLSDGATAEHLRRGTVFRKVLDDRVDYVILPVDYVERFPSLTNFGYRLRLFDNPAIALDLVASRESPLDAWIRGMQATWNASPRQAVYHVTPTGRAGPGSLRPPLRRSAADPDHLLSQAGRERAGAALGLLAAWGVEVELRLSKAPAPVENDGGAAYPAFRVAMGPWGIALAAPPSASSYEARARSAVAESAGPYLRVGDYDGAALATTHALATAVREGTDPAFMPLLPPLVAPSPGGLDRPIEDSLPWGACVVVACAAFGIALLRTAPGEDSGAAPASHAFS